MTTNGDQGYKDIFYHCIPVLNAKTSKELSAKVRQYASELYDEKSSDLKSLASNLLTKESWLRQSQKMVINPNYDSDENTFYISLFKQGSCSGKHGEVVTLLAAKLMSKAPVNHPIQRTVISSDRTCSTANTPWLTYEDGDLVATNQPSGPKS